MIRILDYGNLFQRVILNTFWRLLNVYFQDFFSGLFPFTSVSEVTVHTEIFYKSPPISHIRWLREVQSEQGETDASVCLHSVLQGPWDHFRTLSSLKCPLTRWENWPLMALLCGELAQGRRVRGWTDVWVEEEDNLSVSVDVCDWLCLEVSWTLQLLQVKLDVFVYVDKSLWWSFIWTFVTLFSP